MTTSGNGRNPTSINFDLIRVNSNLCEIRIKDEISDQVRPSNEDHTNDGRANVKSDETSSENIVTNNVIMEEVLEEFKDSKESKKRERSPSPGPSRKRPCPQNSRGRPGDSSENNTERQRPNLSDEGSDEESEGSHSEDEGSERPEIEDEQTTKIRQLEGELEAANQEYLQLRERFETLERSHAKLNESKEKMKQERKLAKGTLKIERERFETTERSLTQRIIKVETREKKLLEENEKLKQFMRSFVNRGLNLLND